MCGLTKKEHESPVKGHNYQFLPQIFPNLGHFEHYTPNPYTGCGFEGFNRE